MANWITKLNNQISARKASDAYWLARMEREIEELQQTNVPNPSSKIKEKTFMVNAKEEKGCIIESKRITIIDKLT